MTIAEARAAIVAALDTAGIRAAGTHEKQSPPYVAVLGDGVTFPMIVRGVGDARFRLVMVAGGFQDAASITMLDALKLACASAMRDLVGSAAGDINRDAVRRIGANDYLTADMSATIQIEL